MQVWGSGMVTISERTFEDAIQSALLRDGPDDPSARAGAVRETLPAYGENVPGGYRKRAPEEYDRALCLVPHDVVDFILATQPKDWAKLKQHHGSEVRERFLKRLAQEIGRRGGRGFPQPSSGGFRPDTWIALQACVPADFLI